MNVTAAPTEARDGSSAHSEDTDADAVRRSDENNADVAHQTVKVSPQEEIGPDHEQPAAMDAEADIEAARRAIGRGDATVLQALLNEAFAEPERIDPHDKPIEPPPEIDSAPEQSTLAVKPRPERGRKWTNRIIRSLIGLALLVFAVWVPAQQLFQIASAEAVVNAPLVTLRAPISGTVGAGTPVVGDDVTTDQNLMQITNPRTDLSALDAADSAVADSLEERDLLVARIDGLETQRLSLEAQLEAFRQGRIALLGARLRGEELAAAERDAIEIELDALQRGVFLGDSYNDKPSSAQRLDQIAIELSDLEAQLSANLARYPRVVEAQSVERMRADQAASATIYAPSSGSIWEMLAAPGEQIAAGQDVMRMLDCSNALVTAVVSEAVYNQLVIGTPAAFTFREGGPAMTGEVVQLSGIGVARSNYAITPGALQAESYRVTVAVPAVASGAGCAVGRTGRVVFDPA